MAFMFTHIENHATNKVFVREVLISKIEVSCDVVREVVSGDVERMTVAYQYDRLA